MHPLIFTRIASAELTEAQDWYQNEAPGLGRRLREAVDAVLERMSANPRQFPVIYKSARRALLRRFPYALMFVIEPDDYFSQFSRGWTDQPRTAGSTVQ